jgi:hypothetical protein
MDKAGREFPMLSEYFLPLDDYGKFTLMLAPYLKSLMERINKSGCNFPADVLVVDAENKMLSYGELRMNVDNPFSDLSGRAPEEKLPEVCWPVTATVSDKDGTTWNLLIPNPKGHLVQ